MARSYGRTASAIWLDPDFLALDEGPQRLYLFLLSQPDLSHAGLVPMRVKRWAKKAANLSVGTMQERIGTLDYKRFIVTDQDTEEVLIRTFVRNDGVYKQPKVMLRMREDAQQIESPRLRAAFRAELGRLPLHELSDKPAGQHADQPSTRASVQAVVDTLFADFADVVGYPSEGVSDTPHVRAIALPHPPTPIPLPPSPTTNPEEHSAKAESVIDVPVIDKATGKTVPDPAVFDAFWQAYGKKTGKVAAEKAWAKAIKTTDSDDIIAAAYAHADWHMRERTEARFVPHPATWLNGQRWNDERASAHPKLSTTDQRVADNIALTQRLMAEDAANESINVRAIGTR